MKNCTSDKKYDITSLRVFYVLIDGILHSMVQNIQNQDYWSICLAYVKSTTVNPHHPAILKATLTRFHKVTYVWAYG